MPLSNQKKILVIGESCRDIFVYCGADRIAPAMPVPVLNVKYQVENGGMAQNVYRNISSIYPHCDILTNQNWNDVTKSRYMHDETNHAFFRVDSTQEIKKIVLDKEKLAEYSLIVVADYDKGFLSEVDIEEICNNHDMVFLDTKKPLGDWCLNATYIKINDYEYQRSIEYINSNKQIFSKVIHTKGGDGCVFLGNKYPVKKIEVKDSSGAGDSFMAAFAVKYLLTENVDESINYANNCASQVVTKRGVTII